MNGEFYFISEEEKRKIDKEGKHFIYEHTYIPFNDTILRQSGIEFIARTEIKNNRIVSNKIVIKKHEKESLINCIHVVVGEISFDKEGHLQSKEFSIESHPKQANLLGFEDHFFALKSYLEGILELGMINCLFKSIEIELDGGASPIDFNHYFRIQLIKAFEEIDSEIVKEIVKISLERYYPNQSRFFDKFPIRELNKYFKEIVINGDVSDKILERLADSSDDEELIEAYYITKNVSQDEIMLKDNIEIYTKTYLPKNDPELLNLNVKIQIRANLPNINFQPVGGFTTRSDGLTIFTSIQKRYSVVIRKGEKEFTIEAEYPHLSRINNSKMIFILLKTFLERLIGYGIKNMILASGKIDLFEIKSTELSDDEKNMFYIDNWYRCIIIEAFCNVVPEFFSPEIINELCSHKDENVRAFVAQNFKLNELKLIKLTRDPDLGVRNRLSHRENLPPTVLEILSTDQNFLIRSFISKKNHV